MYYQFNVRVAHSQLPIFLYYMSYIADPLEIWKWNFRRRLSGYELAGNEIFLRHGSIGGLGQLKCSMGRMECYMRDAYHLESILGRHLV